MHNNLDTMCCFIYEWHVKVHKLNRDSRENREWSRRCNPGFSLQSVKNPFSLDLPLFRLIVMGRLLKGRGSQKTCLDVLLLVCGQRNKRQQLKG